MSEFVCAHGEEGVVGVWVSLCVRKLMRVQEKKGVWCGVVWWVCEFAGRGSCVCAAVLLLRVGVGARL